MHLCLLMLRQLAIGLLVAVTPSSFPAVSSPSIRAIQAARTGTLIITVALVDREMRVRPVPLHPMILVGADNDTVPARTSVDGSVTLALPPGSYSLHSRAPVTFEDQRFRWDVTLAVGVNKTLNLALSGDNAIKEPVPSAEVLPPPAKMVEPATTLFDRLKHSVFRIEAGLAHGTGFLADTLDGVILTNAHVVENSEPENLSVVLEPSTRVRAQLLARDTEADVAVLRVHPRYLSGRVRVPLQNPLGRVPVVPGEKLLAMGYPLHQELTLTSGIASSVRAGAIISDVNINPGNSGGPLLNAEGEAVAVNTFGDVAARGAGVSGSVLVALAGPALARAAAELQRAQSITDDSLPIVPTVHMNIATLKAFADTIDVSLYQGFSNITLGGFALTIQTPTQTFAALKEYENEVAKDRKRREAKAGLSEEERYSEVREYRDWADYVGAPTTPVVAISVIPKTGETSGSIFARALISPYLRATYKFQGDVRGVQVFRNGESVEAVRGGHAPTRMFLENRWVSLKDVADQGFYVYDIEMLRPDTNGVSPSIVVTVQDLKNPKKLKCLELPATVLARAWNDFEGFYRESKPGVRFWRADAKVSKQHHPEWQNDGLKRECNWYTAESPRSGRSVSSR